MSAATARLLKDADLCVKCGLCLPHCPTYVLSGHEADSPRGRITLIQGVHGGIAGATVPLTPALEAHLDSCLSCRACEAVCPAKVPFGRLMDGARRSIAEQRPLRSALMRGALALLSHAGCRTVLVKLLRLYQKLPLSRWLRAQLWWTRTALGRIEALLPSLSSPPPGPQTVPADAPRVQLFTGCTGTWLDAAALADTVKVLNHLGYAVDLPQPTRCCGALHQHAGLHTDAARLARQNVQTLSATLPILSVASGCGATLRDYADLTEGGAGFSARVHDVSRFVLEHWPTELALKPMTARIAVHAACTQKNVLRADTAMYALLQKIPGVELVPLDSAARCCGAAGATVITDPLTADLLRQPKLDAAARLRPDFIASGNIGCSLHLAAGLRRAGLSCEVLHPMSLLARCLEPAAPAPLRYAASAVRPARPG